MPNLKIIELIYESFPTVWLLCFNNEDTAIIAQNH